MTYEEDSGYPDIERIIQLVKELSPEVANLTEEDFTEKLFDSKED